MALLHASRTARVHATRPTGAVRGLPVTATAASTKGTTLEQAFQTMVHARNSFEKHVNATNEARHHYTTEGYRDQLDRFKTTEAYASVDQAAANVKARRDQAQADADKVRQSLSPNGDSAAESRAARYWHRNERLLDSIADGPQRLTAARELVQAATREELGLLLQELPAYLKSCGANADWIEPTVQQLIPEYGEAHERLKKSDAALQFTNQAASYLKRNFDSGTVPSAQLLEQYNPHTAGRVPGDRRGTLPSDNGGRYDPDVR